MGMASRKRKSMQMAKVISELWADNIINPETKVTFADEKQKDKLEEWFTNLDKEHGIYDNLNDLVELTFALGLGATVQSKDQDGKVFQQYVNATMIKPLKIVLGEIVDCAFISTEENGDHYIQIHEKQKTKYKITNLLVDKDGKKKKLENMVESFESEVKLFQLYKPAIVNNINLMPLGISIYANAIEELRSVDIAFDGLDKELRNARSRMFLSIHALHTVQGKPYPIFDKDQDEFYILPEDEDHDPVVVKESSYKLEPLVMNLEKQLNLLGSKCGLGDNAFYSKEGSIYTNTKQVISTNSKFFKTRQKHAGRFAKPLIEMVKALYFLEFGQIIDGIDIDFDDTIIHDKEAEREQARVEFASGLISAVEYHRITRGQTTEEAEQFWKEQVEQMGLADDIPEEGGEV